jgi:hypothetical protein
VLYCGAEVRLGSTLQHTAQRGPWYRFDVPLSAFACNSGSSAGSLDNVNRVDWENPNLRDADFCLDGIVLLPSTPTSDRANAAATTTARGATTTAATTAVEG